MEKYFAYGSNLNIGQMKHRCPSARFFSRASLKGYRLDFPRRSERWNGGVAGIIRDPSNTVQGVVYEISKQDLSRLDEYEGTSVGRYRRQQLLVELEHGGTFQVWTYLANSQTGWPFPPSTDYLQTMLTGAAEHKLSKEYVEHLRTFFSHM